MTQELLVDDEGTVVQPPVDNDELTTTDHDGETTEAAPNNEAPEAGDGGEEGDGEAGHADGETDDEREAIRHRRREERRQKKEAQREREEGLRREIEAERAARLQAESRLSVLERKASGMELSTIDAHLKQAADLYSHFKNQIAVASAAGDHAAIADATEKMILSRDRYNQLNNVKEAYQRQQQQPAPLDPSMLNHAQSWMERNSWYDPDGADPDSHLASKIDERLAQEGFNPSTPQYWTELDNRLKKYLPHRYKTGYNKPQHSRSQPRSPVQGGGGEGNGNPSGSTYRLSAERVTALKEAGIEPGTAAFKDAVKRYKEYDQQQQSAAN